MEGKPKALSKKTIIAIVTIIVLLFIAGLSVGIFLADKGKTEAVDGNQTSQTESTSQGEGNNEQNENPVAENPENQNGEGEQNNGEQNVNTPDNTGETQANNETANNETNNNEQQNNAVENNGTTANTEVTTGINVNDVGETTITRVEEQEKLVSKDFWDWWTPINVAVASTTANINAENPDLVVKKSVITQTGTDISSILLFLSLSRFHDKYDYLLVQTINCLQLL